MSRHDGRSPDQLRPISITLNPLNFADGSVIVEFGLTRVLCAVTIETSLPGWLRGQGKGWVNAEYSLLPRSTHTRTRRERDGIGGRTQEIQRLIGRSLRASLDLTAMPEHMFVVDCDVLQADGGTRTAAITGGFVALELAIRKLMKAGTLQRNPVRSPVAAVSVGVVGGEPVLDLDYIEDKDAGVDLNVVMNAAGGLIEVQGTAEGEPFSREHLEGMIDLAELGIIGLLQAQREALAVVV